MEERIPLLRGKVGAEAKAMDKKLQDLSQDWEARRPLSKEHSPAEVQYVMDSEYATMGRRTRCCSCCILSCSGQKVEGSKLD